FKCQQFYYSFVFRFKFFNILVAEEEGKKNTKNLFELCAPFRRLIKLRLEALSLASMPGLYKFLMAHAKRREIVKSPNPASLNALLLSYYIFYFCVHFLYHFKFPFFELLLF